MNKFSKKIFIAFALILSIVFPHLSLARNICRPAGDVLSHYKSILTYKNQEYLLTEMETKLDASLQHLELSKAGADPSLINVALFVDPSNLPIVVTIEDRGPMQLTAAYKCVSGEWQDVTKNVFPEAKDPALKAKLSYDMYTTKNVRINGKPLTKSDALAAATSLIRYVPSKTDTKIIAYASHPGLARSTVDPQRELFYIDYIDGKFSRVVK